MKFSEKMLLLKQGATFADVKKMEEEEALEIAEGKKHQDDVNNQQDDANNQQDDANGSQDDANNHQDDKELLTALEAATLALEESKATIDKQKKDYEKLNEEFLKLTNSQTLNDNVTKTGADVFAELFNNQSNKEES